MATRKKRKKFGQTTVGKILGTGLGLINPLLGGLVGGTNSVEDLIQGIKDANVPAEDKIRAQEMVLEAYEAEVADRVSARQREATVAAAGGSDILFKVIGWSIAAAFLVVVAAAVGLWEVQESQQRLFDMGFGAVIAQMTAVVSYYFGSSFGSKQKTDIMNKLNEGS